jgi:hypothetical protein
MLEDIVITPPHGGRLVNLVAEPERRAELQRESRGWP